MPYQGSYEQKVDHARAKDKGESAETAAAVAARQEEARKNITKRDKAASAVDDDPEPQAKDFPNLGAWGAARTAWRAKRAQSPQKQAIAGMLEKKQAAK